MDRERIWLQKQIFELGNISLQEAFENACEDAYRIRVDSEISPISRCRFRAQAIAFPLTAMWLNLEDLLKAIAS